jgi:hypothetical protein
LNAVGYTINQINPTRSDSVYPTCGSELENNINRNFEGEPFQNCGWDFFMVHYTGFITIPENTSVRFMVAADDGGTVNIGGYNMGTWNLKGCSWSQQVTLPLSGGTYPLDGWFYEWTGGSCYMLAWQLDDGDWEIVPEWAFTTTSTPATTTTTTTAPSTTVPATTITSTTLQETSTTTTTTIETTEPIGTTSTASSTTTITTEPGITTTSSTVDTSPPATSPTPEAVAPPPATTIEPATNVPEESTPEEQQPPVTDPPVPDTSLVEPPASEPTVPDPQEPAVEDAPILPPDASESSESDAIPETVVDTPETLSEALNASPEELSAYIEDLPAEEVVALVDALLADNPTPEQVTALATNPEVLAVVSTEQAAEIFETLDVGDLTDTEVEALIAAVQDAPTEIRATFEDTINIFGEGLDDYVPLGSTIPVGTRRTLIAVTAGITLAAAGSRIRR